MRCPPYWMQLKFRGEHHEFSLWLPLFIIGPILLIILLALAIAALPFLVLSVIFTWRWDWWWYVRKAPALVDVILSLPGLKADVDNQTNRVTIAIY
jgi:hypothetical protein